MIRSSFYSSRRIYTLTKGQGIYVKSKVKHLKKEELEFLVISQPHAHGGRELMESSSLKK